MRNRKRLIILFFLSPLSLFAQDITGLWKGTLYNDTTQQFYRYEIGISQEKGKLTGFSHTWFILGDRQFFGVKKVAIKKAADGKIIIEDDGLISNNYPVSPGKHVRQLNVLTLNSADSIMTLEGPFTTNRTKEYHSLTGQIKLQRKNDFWQSSLVPHLQELGLENKLSFVKEENDLIALVEAKQDAEVFKQLEQQQKDALAKEEANKAAEKKLIEEKATRKQALAAEEKLARTKAMQETADREREKKTTDEQVRKDQQAKKEAEKLLAKQAAENKLKAEKEQAMRDAAAKQLAEDAAEQKLVDEKALAKQTIAPALKKSAAPVFPHNLVPAANVNLRKTVLQQTVTFKSDSLQLTLYDNGEVDGDTVSVLMNGQLIIPKQGLSTTAARKTIYIPSTMDTVELVMYAESLGSIPPNTGLLVIRDGKDLYEIRFSGDLQKNASIVFRRKKE